MNSTLKAVIDYVEYRAAQINIEQVIVANNAFDDVIPEGTTFVFPRGGVVIDPMWHPKFDLSEKDIKLINPPQLWFLLPELTFKVTEYDDGDIVVIGMSPDADVIAERINRQVFDK